MSTEKKYIGNSKTFSTILKVVWITLLVLAIIALVRSCAVCKYRTTIIDQTGYLPDLEDWDNIPVVIPPYDDKDTQNLLNGVMLEKYFPPIGDQGNKGTCVAWAVGYNLKTALNAIDSGWTPDMLKKPEYQTSPKDLYLNVPSSQKGKSCSGSQFEGAFKVLETKGATTMKVMPYIDLKDCSATGIGDTNNRILSFHRVVSNSGDNPSVTQLKAYLNDTIPLVFGARLGDRFMKWSNDDVLNHDTYYYNGMHAYHAMVLVGYDDNRHAFRVRNSWGESWGDKGSIWVDYNFFINELCYVVFEAKNK